MWRTEARQASVMLRVELGLMRRIWKGRARGGEVMGVLKGDLFVCELLVGQGLLLLDEVGRWLDVRCVGLEESAERETGREGP